MLPKYSTAPNLYSCGIFLTVPIPSVSTVANFTWQLSGRKNASGANMEICYYRCGLHRIVQSREAAVCSLVAVLCVFDWSRTLSGLKLNQSETALFTDCIPDDWQQESLDLFAKTNGTMAYGCDRCWLCWIFSDH